jgi:hypothetical protein
LGRVAGLQAQLLPHLQAGPQAQVWQVQRSEGLGFDIWVPSSFRGSEHDET